MIMMMMMTTRRVVMFRQSFLTVRIFVGRKTQKYYCLLPSTWRLLTYKHIPKVGLQVALRQFVTENIPGYVVLVNTLFILQ